MAKITQSKQVPQHNHDEWNKIQEITECPLFKSVKHLTHKQFVHVLDNYFFDAVDQSDNVKLWFKAMLIEKKDSIISYVEEKEINGNMFDKMTEFEFVKLFKEKKLHSALVYLYRTIKQCDLAKINDIPYAEHECKEIDYEDLMRDCPAYRKVTMILKHFEAIDTYYSG
eukprot:1014604_1